jgi:hypothetical protein
VTCLAVATAVAIRDDVTAIDGLGEPCTLGVEPGVCFRVS